MSEEQEHLVSYKTFSFVWGILLVLTGLTVWVAQYNLGALNIWVALTIASVKSGLVILFFMHMKYEQLVFKLCLLATLAILAIFIGFTFLDVLYR